MTRRWQWALGLLAGLAATAVAQEKPTKGQTMDYLARKVAVEKVATAEPGDQGEAQTRQAHLSFPALWVDGPTGDDRVIVLHETITGDENAPTHCALTVCEVPLHRLDPERVAVRRAPDEQVARSRNRTPWFELTLHATGDAKAFRARSFTGSSPFEIAFRGSGASRTGTDALPGEDHSSSEDTLTFADEAAARAAAKAFAHLIRECGGVTAPAPPADPTARYFEGDDPVASAPAPTQDPAATTPATPPAGESRADQRRRLQKELIDAEAALPAAMRRDAANQEWNDHWEAALRKRIADIEANAKAARQKGETVKSLALEAATLPLMAELDKGELRRDTRNAERLRQRIIELRKQLIDLGD